MAKLANNINKGLKGNKIVDKVHRDLHKTLLGCSKYFLLQIFRFKRARKGFFLKINKSYKIVTISFSPLNIKKYVKKDTSIFEIKINP